MTYCNKLIGSRYFVLCALVPACNNCFIYTYLCIYDNVNDWFGSFSEIEPAPARHPFLFLAKRDNKDDV